MAKKFNITGTCIPGEHYMADTSGKLRQIMAMVEGGDYFIINRPRQYGKTTMLHLLASQLQQSQDYLPFSLSFEGIGDDVFMEEKKFSQKFIQMLAIETRYTDKTLSDWLEEKKELAKDLGELASVITDLVQRVGKRVVLLIDEVDKSSNNQLFVSFLGVLRSKYLNRHLPQHRTFHSVVLAGVHDVKSLKLKIRPEAEQKFNSPWNIAAAFEVDMSLQPAEILPMLEDYAREKGVKMDAPAIAGRLFFFTSGYPFLVSKLCKLLDEKILPQKSKAAWTDEDLEAAVNLLLKEGNANFDSLMANLENNPGLYKVVYSILMEGEYQEYNIHDPVVNLGMMYGVFRNGAGIQIHNRIYSEVILNYMTSKVKREILMEGYNIGSQFRLPGNRLDMKNILLQFQAFMKEQQSKHDQDFLERNGRLIFLAFLKPIINGGGWDFKEPQISGEKRLDVAITFFQHKYVVELKIWRGEAAHQKGLKQLAEYLGLQRLEQGYLLIFDHSKKKTWKHKPMKAEGKKVLAVWV